MSLSSGFAQGLSTPVPVAGAGLPDDLTLYAGGPLDPLKAHEAKYKQLDRMQRMSDRESAKMLAELEKAERQYYGDKDEDDDLDKVSFVSSHPLLRRQYLLKMAQGSDLGESTVVDTIEAGDPEAPFEIVGAGPGTPYKSFDDWATPGRRLIGMAGKGRYDDTVREHQAFKGDITKLTDQELADWGDLTTGPIDNFGNRLRYQKGDDAGKYTSLAHRVDTERARRDLAKYRDTSSAEYKGISSYPASKADNFDTGSLRQLQDFQRRMQANQVGEVPTTAKEYYAQGDKGKFYPEFIRGVERRRVMLPKVQQDIDALKARELSKAQETLAGRVRRNLAPTSLDRKGRQVRNENPFATMDRARLDNLRDTLGVTTPITSQYGRQEFGLLPEDKRTELGGSFDAYLDRQAQTIANRRRFAIRDSELSKQEEAAEIKARQAYEAKQEVERQRIADETAFAENDMLKQQRQLELERLKQEDERGFAENEDIKARQAYEAKQEVERQRIADEAGYAENDLLDQQRKLRLHEQVEEGLRRNIMNSDAYRAAEGDPEMQAALLSKDPMAAANLGRDREEGRALNTHFARKERDARLDDRANMAAGFANNRGIRQDVNQQRADRGINTAFRRAQALKDLSAAYQRQKLVDPGSVPPAPAPAPAPAKPAPAQEPSYWDQTKGFFSDVGDSLKGMGARVVRQGTQGLQQAANYGLRNSEFLEGLVDDDEEARILASLAQGSTGDDRKMYLKQLKDFTARGVGNKGRTFEQQARMDALSGGNYQSLRNMHLEEQARKRGINPANDPEAFAKIEEDYGPAFDMYYGVGDKAKELGIKPLHDDSFVGMYGEAKDRFNALRGEAKDRFNAFRRAKKETAPEQQAVTDPSSVVPPEEPAPSPQPAPFRPLETIPMGDLSQDTQSYLQQHFGTDLNGEPYDLSDPKQLGRAFRDKMEVAEPEAMKALQYMANDLPPQQMTKVLMSAMPNALNLGAKLNQMTDEEAIAYIEAMPDEVQKQIDNFTNFTARFIAPQFQGQYDGISDNPNPTINRVREATPEEIQQHGGLMDRLLHDYLGDYAPTQYIDETKLLDPNVKEVDIDNEFGWTGLGSGAGKWYIVPGGGGLGSTLLYNPQTGEFNREWGTLRNYEELPSRYNDALSKSFQQQNSSIGPLF